MMVAVDVNGFFGFSAGEDWYGVWFESSVLFFMVLLDLRQL